MTTDRISKYRSGATPVGAWTPKADAERSTPQGEIAITARERRVGHHGVPPKAVPRVIFSGRCTWEVVDLVGYEDWLRLAVLTVTTRL